MLTRVFSAAIQGVEAIEVEIEVNAGPGDPKIIVVGLPDTAVKESKDRVTTAIANSGFRWPRERTTINLAPADIKKEGPSFDLPIAIGMITVALGAEVPRLERCLMAGELALNGELRSIKGALPIALEARRRARGITAQSGTPTPSATDDDKARRDSIVASNLGQDRAPSFGSDPRKQGGGVFQIQGETFDRAELIFYGWNKEIGRMSAQAIEVRKGDNPDIRFAVVRKMIAIIRDQEKNDFIWDSRRLGRSLNLSARLEDNAGLEEVLMREFYEVRR